MRSKWLICGELMVENCTCFARSSVFIGVLSAFLTLNGPISLVAQAKNTAKPPKSADDGMAGMQMDMPGMTQGTDMSTPDPIHPKTFLEAIEHHAASGTSAEPNSTPAPMLMTTKGPWMLMFHANVFLDDIQQTSSRGGDKLFSTNWLMPMAQRNLGPGRLTVRTMVSLEPATITGERYPLLFQQGETAYGLPIADGQHPHNLIMELAALYDLPLGKHSLLSLYAAPVGDPAIGPTAYPHRASAAEDPVATLGHHQEDSTHVAYDVATVGLTIGIARIEASGFHGREPSEHRWQMTQGSLDSWSTRLTLQPGQNWSGQYSYARIASPEALYPTENQERMTASAMYNRPLAHGNWASTLLWGRTRGLGDPPSNKRKQLPARVDPPLRPEKLRLDPHRERRPHQRTPERREAPAARLYRVAADPRPGLHVRLQPGRGPCTAPRNRHRSAGDSIRRREAAPGDLRIGPGRSECVPPLAAPFEGLIPLAIG